MNLTIRGKMLLLGSAVFAIILAILLNFYINQHNGLKYVEKVTGQIVEKGVNEKIKVLTLSMAESLGGLLEGVTDEKQQISPLSQRRLRILDLKMIRVVIFSFIKRR